MCAYFTKYGEIFKLRKHSQSQLGAFLAGGLFSLTEIF